MKSTFMYIHKKNQFGFVAVLSFQWIFTDKLTAPSHSCYRLPLRQEPRKTTTPLDFKLCLTSKNCETVT